MFKTKTASFCISVLFFSALPALVGCGAKQPDSNLIEEESTDASAEPAAEPPSKGYNIDGQAPPQAPPAPPSAQVAPLKFNWPIPCKVTVTEHTTKKGTEVKSKFEVSVVRGDTDDELYVRFGRPEHIELDGQALNPKANKTHALTLAMAAAMPAPPDMVITNEGLFKKFADFDIDNYRKETLSAIRLDKFMTPKEAQRVKQMYLSPAFIKATHDKLAEKWRVWVEAWIGLQVAEGKEQRGGLPIALNENSTIMAKVTIRNLGYMDDETERLTLQLLVEQKDPKLAEMMLRVLRQMAASDQSAADEFANNLKAVEKYSSVTAEIDPISLIPSKVTAIENTVLILKDGTKDIQGEEHLYTFDWTTR
jgi:hypothetical protein